jgi:iron-sulfur cluster assembly accessory protein
MAVYLSTALSQAARCAVRVPRSFSFVAPAAMHVTQMRLVRHMASVPPSDGLGQLIVTPAAVRRLNALQEKHRTDAAVNAADLMLRVQLASGGCSGFKYTLALEHGQPMEDDILIERNGARVVMDKSSLELMEGSTVDFTEELGRTGFVVINNPRAATSCGCGSSFTVKE